MRPTDPIQDLFKQAHYPADADQTERILGDALDVIDQRAATPRIRKRPSRWRRLMTSRTTQLSAAAVVLLALGLFFFNLNNTPVYGMSEVPGLYKLAHTLHFKGTQYFPEDNSSKSAQIEEWIDLDQNRWRSLSQGYVVNNGKVTVYPTELVCNGQGMQMVLSHSQKVARYLQMTDLQQVIERQNQERRWHAAAFGDTSFYDAYECIAQETIDGVDYEIWEAVKTEHSQSSYRMQSWLNPKSGDVLRVKTWWLSEEGQWLLSSELNTIERNIEIPAEVFSMEPPVDYDVNNTPETAEPKPNRYLTIGDWPLTLTGYLAFILPDGSLLTCWSSGDKDHPDELQADTFSHLEKGGAFPELPYQMHQLKAQMDDREYVFPGCHLAYTQKDGQFYEWGLYVSESGKLDERLSMRSFMGDHLPRSSSTMWMQVAAVIETPQDFQDLVIAAMAEFADEGTVPELTLDEVLTLASTQRNSLK